MERFQRLVKIGRQFFRLTRGSGLLDDAGKPIQYCAECSAKYDNTEIYHRRVSATYK